MAAVCAAGPLPMMTTFSVMADVYTGFLVLMWPMLASLAQLDKSHRRHDEVMEALLAAARRLAAGRPDAGDIHIVRDAIGYFSRAGTRHLLAEEGSVFPRPSARRPGLAAAPAPPAGQPPGQSARPD